MQAEGGENMGTAYNRAYLASFHSTQILLRRTSDTLEALDEMLLGVCHSKVREYELTNTICASV